MYKNDHEYKPIQLEKDQRKVARKKKKKRLGTKCTVN